MDEKLLIQEFIDNEISLSQLASNHKIKVKEAVEIFRKHGYIFRGISSRNCILYLKDAIDDYKNGLHSLTKLAKKYNLARCTISSALKLLGIEVINEQNTLRFDENIFNNINNEEKAYWLGFIYADGNISRIDGYKNSRYHFEITIKESDKMHLYKFNAFTKHINDNVKKKIVKLNNKIFIAYRWAVSNKNLWESLNNLGCTPKKSLTLTFPKKEIFSNEKLIIPFIRGYFDGDGCISYHCNNKNICNVSVLLVGTKNVLENIAKTFNFKKYRIVKKGNAYQICFNVQDSFNFIKEIYNNASIYLDRKFNRANLFLNNNNAVQKSDLLDY